MLTFSQGGWIHDALNELNMLLVCPAEAWAEADFMQRVENVGAQLERAHAHGGNADKAFEDLKLKTEKTLLSEHWTFLNTVWPQGTDSGACGTAYVRSPYSHPCIYSARMGCTRALEFLFKKGQSAQIYIQGSSTCWAPAVAAKGNARES